MNNTTEFAAFIADNNDTGILVGYGALFGIIHIITAPDHISAMITISVNNGIRAFYTGIKWGVGHSVGLFIIYSVLITIDDDILSKTYIVDWIIGIFLILLGFHGVYKTWKHYKAEKNQIQLEAITIEDIHLEHTENRYIKCIDIIKNSLLSLIIGILHGLAGSGGILGIFPAILINDRAKSIAYLSTFCITGTITMGIFSALWGELSKQITNRLGIILLSLSSLLSIVMGSVWIGLLATDQLDIIFSE